MKLILLLALLVFGVLLLTVLVFFLLIARNLKAIAAAIARASSLAEAVEQHGGPPVPAAPRPRPTMREIFAVLPSVLKRADRLRGQD
jgi:hypothetical protein